MRIIEFGIYNTIGASDIVEIITEFLKSSGFVENFDVSIVSEPNPWENLFEKSNSHQIYVFKLKCTDEIVDILIEMQDNDVIDYIKEYDHSLLSWIYFI